MPDYAFIWVIDCGQSLFLSAMITNSPIASVCLFLQPEAHYHRRADVHCPRPRTETFAFCFRPRPNEIYKIPFD